MKFDLPTFLPMVLLGTAQIRAECVPGEQEEVVPGYNVEYQCDMYRSGSLYRNIPSLLECAEICKEAPSPYCSYSLHHRQCVVGDLHGEDITRSGVTYMKQIRHAHHEEPFPPDMEEPFPEESCEEVTEVCEREKTRLDERLQQCEARTRACDFSFVSAECPRHHQQEVSVRCKKYKQWCGRYHNPATPKNIVTGIRLPECIEYCSNRAWCTYVLHNAAMVCHVYDRKVSYSLTPGVADGKWDCAVKAPN